MPGETPAPVGTFNGVVPTNGGTINNGNVASLAIAAGAVYVFAYTIHATGTCDEFYFAVIFPDNSQHDIVPGGSSIQGTDIGAAQLYLAPGNYELSLGALGAPIGNSGNHAAAACTYRIVVAPT